jgi:hypothetical protein
MSIKDDRKKIVGVIRELKPPFTPSFLFKKVSEKGLRSNRLYYEALNSLEKDGAIKIKETKRRVFENKKKKYIYPMPILDEIENVKRLMLENTDKLIEKHSKELKKKNEAEKKKILIEMMNEISARFCYRLIEFYGGERGKEWVRNELNDQYLLCLERLEKGDVLGRLRSMGYKAVKNNG